MKSARCLVDEALRPYPARSNDEVHELAAKMCDADWSGRKPACGPHIRVTVALDQLVTDKQAMVNVLAWYDSGQFSETPQDPLLLYVRNDGRGLEIGDGHHRVARAIRTGRTRLRGVVEYRPDDEPYQGPFYDFHQHLNGQPCARSAFG